MAQPIPVVAANSGDAQDAPAGAVPIDLYGAGGSGGAAVESVNGQAGVVVLDADDVGALPDTYTPPAPTWASVTGKPTTFPPVIGTTATTAKAGNAVQTATQTTATAIAPGTATNVQGILAELAARITALEAGTP